MSFEALKAMNGIFASGVALSQGILALQGSPSTSGFSGVALATQPFVQLNDFQGQPRLISGVSVTAFISSSTGVISGTTTVTTNSNGRATFTNLSLAPAGTYFIRLSSLGYLSTSSGNITIQ